jgi:hypothetical protein
VKKSSPTICLFGTGIAPTNLAFGLKFLAFWGEKRVVLR